MLALGCCYPQGWGAVGLRSVREDKLNCERIMHPSTPARARLASRGLSSRRQEKLERELPHAVNTRVSHRSVLVVPARHILWWRTAAHRLR
jgi:hypothetical protein